MIRTDFHMHSKHSFDGSEEPEDMVRAAIEKGLSAMAITDHQDWDPYPYHHEFSAEEYMADIEPLIEKYAGVIEITPALEMGLAPERTEKCRAYTEKHPFGFVIGSVHTINGVDPYFGDYYKGRSLDEAYREDFLYTAACLKEKPDIDVLGHLDYVVRYGDKKNGEGFYARFAEEIDEILRLLIEQGKGIEVNTAGLRYGLEDTNPSREVIRRYRELGGEIVTLGSDAHRICDMTFAFDVLPEFLKSCGFSYYTYYQGRKPKFLRIE